MTIAHTEHLDLTRVPVLPAGIGDLIAALGGADMTNSQLAAVIEQYPSIALRLLALANSAWSAPAHAITALDQACGRLGYKVVRSVAIALAVSAPFDHARCPAFDGRRFWCRALLSADIAEWLSAKGGHFSGPDPITPGGMRSAALVRDLGLLWLADGMPLACHAALTECAQAPQLALASALRQHCGTDHHQTGSQLAEAWHLPRLLAVAMCDEADTEDPAEYTQALRLLHLGSRIADAAELGQAELAAAPDEGPAELASTEITALIKRAQIQLGRTRELAQSLFSR